MSRDDGITWERSEIAPVNVPLSDPDLGLDRDGNVYAGSIDQSGALFMSVSRDAGRSWRPLPDGGDAAVRAEPVPGCGRSGTGPVVA